MEMLPRKFKNFCSPIHNTHILPQSNLSLTANSKDILRTSCAYDKQEHTNVSKKIKFKISA